MAPAKRTSRIRAIRARREAERTLLRLRAMKVVLAFCAAVLVASPSAAAFGQSRTDTPQLRDAASSDAPTKPRSVKLAVAGSILTTLGTGAIIAATTYLVTRRSCPGAPSAASTEQDWKLEINAALCNLDHAVLTIYAGGAIAAGTSFLIAGVPMTVVGLWSVPATNQSRSAGAQSLVARWSF